MNILFINDLLEWGGVETVLSNLSNHFKMQHNVSILIMGRKKQFDCNNFLGINTCFTNKYYRVKTARNFIKYLRYKYFYYRKLATTIKSLKPDLIVVMKEFNIEIMSKLCDYYNIKSKLIGSMHNNCMVHECKKSELKEEYKNIDCLTVLTNQDKEFYEKYAKIPVFIMPNPLNLPLINLKKENIVLLVSRIDYEKRVDLFVKAVAICQKKIKNYDFVIIGSGPKTDEIKQLAREINADVKFLGQLSISKTYEYFARSKISVLSSEMEGFPCVLQEAMFYGCARISTRYKGESLEILIDDKKDGLICQLNEEDMAKKIMMIANDDYARECMINAAKDKFLRLNQYTYQKWEELINNLSISNN